MNAATPELHIPDLPEVPLALGPVRSDGVASVHVPMPLGLRLRRALSTYLPLLLMALLASSTWWLVKHTPLLEGPSGPKAVRHDPDYTMEGFTITRFGPDGKLALRIEGDQMRHYPDTDRMEIDRVRIHAIGPDGRTTDAVAQRALANGDGSEVQLFGGAQVQSQLKSGEVLQIESEFLHAFLRFERLRSHLPVRVQRGASQTLAGGMDYDNLAQLLQLSGPVRATLAPPTGRKPKS